MESKAEKTLSSHGIRYFSPDPHVHSCTFMPNDPKEDEKTKFLLEYGAISWRRNSKHLLMTLPKTGRQSHND